MENSKIMMFPEMGSNSLDPNLLFALNNNGGFGGNNWIWILFLWMIWGANGWGGNGFGGNNGFLSNQISNDAGREMLMNAIQGNRESINSLANLLNTEISKVQNGIFAINNAITSVGTQVGMSGLQIQNAIQSGNASLASQICQCCCENRLAICQQTNTLQSAINNVSVGQERGFSTVAYEQQAQTCELKGEINSLKQYVGDQFCALKERELQNKIDILTADNALLRSNADNSAQTAFINEKFNTVTAELAAIKASQPNTIPVQWPNVQAVNTTPYMNSFFGCNNGCGSNSFWN